MRVVVLDFETFWNSKNYTLNKVGPIQYIRDPLFHAQLLGYVELPGNGPVRVVEADAIADTLASMRLEAPDTITVAHNGNGFDFLILSERYGIRPHCMIDPICMMRWCGLARLMPCSHAKLTEALGHGVKTAGTVISDGKQWPQDFTPEEQAAFKRYCADDVQQCALNFSWLFQYCTPKAMQFMSLTAKMATNPMLLLDVGLIDEYLRDLDAATEKARESIGKLFHFDTQEDFLKAIRSKSSFVQMLRTFGVEPPMKYSEAKSLTMKAKMEAEGQDTSDPDSYAIYEPALAKTDLEFTAMQEHPDPRVALLVNTRLEQNSSAARSRAVRLRELAGEPLPVMLSAFLAHTSRYTAGQSESASDSINLQNMGKRQAHLKKLRRAIKVPQGYKLVAVDSGQIEARVLAYEAQETELLHHFATGGDPYAEQAEKFGYGPSAQEIHDGAKSGDAWLKTLRNVGKTCILSAGYGVSAKKFSDTLLRQDIKLNEDLDKHYELAVSAHQIYRASNPHITAFWRACDGVLKALLLGGSGAFGGPDGSLLRYGTDQILGRNVPSVWLPTGFALRYPNLRTEMNEQGRMEYRYDQFRGSRAVSTRIYGASLTENCQAKGTLVLTDSGWKPIETIGLSDLVYDGVDFVSHQGLVCKGTQECVCVNGVYMTPDHKILMEEDHESRLRLATPFRPYAPQFQGLNRRDFWEVDGDTSRTNHRQDVDMGVPMRVWRTRATQRSCCAQVCSRRLHPHVRPVHKGGKICSRTYARNDKHPALQCVALNDAALLYTDVSRLPTLRRTRNYGVRKMADVRGFLRGCTRCVSTRAGVGPYKQRRELLPRELPVDNVQRKQQKPRGCVYGSGCESSVKSVWRGREHDLVPYTTWVAAGALDGQTESNGERARGPARVQKEVYDIINCGPRHRFVVRGAEGPFIVANCTQALAFQILMEQACAIDAAGIRIAVNVHDCWAAVVPEASAPRVADTMVQIMSTPPAWAPGLPLSAEAEIGDDYTVA